MGNAGFKSGYVGATAHVTVAPQSGGFKITKSHIVCEARVRGIDQATFAEHAQAAKAGCPVSQSLAGTEIRSKPSSLQIDRRSPRSTS